MKKWISEAFAELTIGLLRDRRRVKLRLSGSCMLPCLLDGDDITVDPIAPDDKLKMGDIVLFRIEHHSMLQAHRLIWHDVRREKQRYVICRSDKGKQYDIVPRASIIGRVSAIERKSQHISMSRCVGRRKALCALLRLPFAILGQRMRR